MRERVWSLDIGGEEFISEQRGRRQFRIVFSVDIAPGDVISYADIRLYNLAKASSIPRQASVVLRAGYDDNVDVIFSGFATNVLRERPIGSPEIVTRLLCKSGEPATDRSSANLSFGVGTRVEEVIRALAREWPRPIEIDNAQFADDPTFTNGYVVDGDIPEALNELAYAYKFKWRQDRGSLIVTKPEKERNAPAIKIDQLSGMIGIPEISLGPDGLGVFVSAQMNPALRYNGKIDIESGFSTFNTGNLFISEQTGDASANGEYNVFAVKHSGDSHGDQWQSEIDGLRPNTQIPAAVVTTTNGKLIYGTKVEQDFRVKVRQIGAEMNINPNWLMAVMGYESRYTFSPAIRNPGSTATGLIQFLERTAIGLGTTTAKLSRMTAVQQLDFVKKYYVDNGYAPRVQNLGDAYLAVLFPLAMNRPDSFIMWRRDEGPYQAAYAVNSHLDFGNKGYITRGDAVTVVNQSFRNGQRFVK